MFPKSLLLTLLIINLKNYDCDSRLNGPLYRYSRNESEKALNTTTMKKARALMIAGGTIVNFDASYVVHLGLPQKNRCVGTLLNPTTILTAAHCVYTLKPSKIYLKAGVNDISQSGGQTVPVKKIIPHPLYNPNLQKNDVAILKLAKPISGLLYMPLPNGGEPVSGKCTAYGWGPILSNLKTVELNHLDQTACSDIEMVQQRIQAGRLNLYNKVCGKSDDNWPGSELGDSGGPLVCNNKVFGVASEVANEPDLDMRVSFYIDVRRYLDFIIPQLKN